MILDSGSTEIERYAHREWSRDCFAVRLDKTYSGPLRQPQLRISIPARQRRPFLCTGW